MRRLLHIASFNGNIGDSLSHRGLYNLLGCDCNLSEDKIDRIEIRRFYQNADRDILKFDGACAEKFNNYRYVILGGGGFLKQSFNNSKYGNTFEFEKEFFKKLRTKLLFYSIGGLNALEKVDEVAYYRTEHFIEKLYSDDRFMFIFRTDGSVKNSQFLNQKYSKDSNSIKQVFDSAFLNEVKSDARCENNVIINIGYDQLLEANTDKACVFKTISETMIHLLDEDIGVKFYFAPHTYYDVQAFTALCEYLPEYLKRNNLKCLQSLTFSTDLQATIDAYSSAKLALTGRFHSAAFAFLYSNNFTPIYQFDRTDAQLKSLLMKKTPLVKSKTLPSLINSKGEDVQLRQLAHGTLSENRRKTVSYLREYLGS